MFAIIVAIEANGCFKQTTGISDGQAYILAQLPDLVVLLFRLIRINDSIQRIM